MKTILFFYLGLLLINASLADEEQVNLDQHYQEYLDQTTDFQKKYILLISPAMKEGDDQFLILTSTGTFEGSEPDIYVHTQKFDSTVRAEYICKSFGIAICHIHTQSLKKVEQIYIIVKCSGECGFVFTSFVESSKNGLTMGTNQVRYAIFEDQVQGTDNLSIISQKIIQLTVTNQGLPLGENVINYIIELELMNPSEQNSTFNAFLNIGKTIPTPNHYYMQGKNWGSGSGMGMFILNKRHIDIEKEYTLNVQAHYGAIIAVRTYGWDQIRYIQPFQLVSGANDSTHTLSKFQLSINQDMPWNKNKDLVISLVPFMGNSDLFIDDKPFSSNNNIKLDNFKWVSKENKDDRIIIPSQELRDLSLLYVGVYSKLFSIFSLRTYFSSSRISINFDYPESGTLEPQEMITYSLKTFGRLETDVTLTLSIIGKGKPGIIVKQCRLQEKDNCVIEDRKSVHQSSLEGQALVVKFKSKPSECLGSENQMLIVCNHIIGVINQERNSLKYILKATNSQSQLSMRDGENYQYRLEYGKIKYYLLDLSHEKDDSMSEIAFELSNHHGQLTMFVSAQTSIPSINFYDRVSFSQSIRISGDEMKLNQAWYLGVQSDSSVTFYEIQPRITYNDSISYITLKENQSFQVNERSDKIKIVHFKFFIQRSEYQTEQISIILDPIVGQYEIRIGTTPTNLNVKETSRNVIKVSETSFESLDNQARIPIYGVVKPKFTVDQSSLIAFRILMKTNQISHELISLGVQNVLILSQIPKLYKIPIHSSESIMITQNINGAYTTSSVLISYEQDNINPTKEDSLVLELSAFKPLIINGDIFQKYCNKQFQEFVVENNCFLFLSISGSPNGKLVLYADINTQEQFIFSDYPNLVPFLPIQQKRLFHPMLTSTEFNLFKSASINGSAVVLCGKIFNNRIERAKWPFPSKCEKGTYDFKIDSESDENYYYKVNQNVDVCSVAQKDCGLALTLFDKNEQSSELINQISITLQQSHTALNANEAVDDSLPANGARFYFLEEHLPSTGSQIRITATEYQRDSIELILYSEGIKITSTKIGHPQLLIDSHFRSQYTSLIQSDVYQVEVKSLSKSKDVSYSLLLTLENEDQQTFIEITPGKPQMVLLKGNEYRYFKFENKQRGKPFKITTSQQTQGFTETTVGRYEGALNQKLPLETIITKTFNQTVTIDEDGTVCQDICIYLIQLLTREANGSQVAITVSSSSDNEITKLLENVISVIELEPEERRIFKFNALIQSTLYFDLIFGNIEISITNSAQKEQIKITTLNEPKRFQQHLQPLPSINDYYYLNIYAKIKSKLSTHFLSMDSQRYISFDQPLHGLSIPFLEKKTFIIRQTGSKTINVQLQYKFGELGSDQGSTAIMESFKSNQEQMTWMQISSTYDKGSNIFIHHILLYPKADEFNIEMSLENSSSSQYIYNLSIYLSQNFSILDVNKPLFYYINQEPLFYGIILPQQRQKILVEITCMQGSLLSQGTINRDDALEDSFSFSSNGLPFRQYFEVEITNYQFFVKLAAPFKHTWGYIKLTVYPALTKLPFNTLSLPNNTIPTITGKTKFINEQQVIDSITINYDSLACISEDMPNNFDLSSIRYSVIITRDVQLAKATDSFHSQLNGDLSSIETSFPYLNKTTNQESWGSTKVIFINQIDSFECYYKCSECSEKTITLPFDHPTIKEYLDPSDGIPSATILVRAIINWKLKNTQTRFSKTLYFTNVKFEKDTILGEIIETNSQDKGLPTLFIILIILIGLGLLSIALFYFCKFKQTEQILNYELTDVRNIAHLDQKQQIDSHIPLEEDESSSSQL